MKVAILGDTHFGMRNDSAKFHDYYEKFYSEVFFPYLEQHGIKDVFQLGDLFDRRKYINFLSLSRARNYFFDPLADNNINLYTLLGNHDIFWKESLKVSSSDLVLRDYDNVFLADQPHTLKFDDGSRFDLIPWICRENEDDVKTFINESKSEYCLGHFEIAGFAMYKGMDAVDGIDPSIFKKYDKVLSGHYHTKSQKGNITYVGTPGEITWQDYNDPRGFHILDTATGELEFIQNPHSIFARIVYDDSEPLNWEMQNINVDDYKDKFVKLIVVAKNDYYKFDLLINSLYNVGVHEVKIVEDFSEYTEGEVDDGINLEDTLDVLDNYIESVETDANKESIKKFMRELYVEASNVEVV